MQVYFTTEAKNKRRGRGPITLISALNEDFTRSNLGGFSSGDSYHHWSEIAQDRTRWRKEIVKPIKNAYSDYRQQQEDLRKAKQRKEAKRRKLEHELYDNHCLSEWLKEVEWHDDDVLPSMTRKRRGEEQVVPSQQCWELLYSVAESREKQQQKQRTRISASNANIELDTNSGVPQTEEAKAKRGRWLVDEDLGKVLTSSDSSREAEGGVAKPLIASMEVPYVSTVGREGKGSSELVALRRSRSVGKRSLPVESDVGDEDRLEMWSVML